MQLQSNSAGFTTALPVGTGRTDTVDVGGDPVEADDCVDTVLSIMDT